MSEENIERLRKMQERIEADAQGVTTYWDLRRLQAYWSDLAEVIALEEQKSGKIE